MVKRLTRNAIIVAAAVSPLDRDVSAISGEAASWESIPAMPDTTMMMLPL